MECNVIKDLLPLYIDKCCSEESVKIVEEHLNECAECKAAFENMNMLLLDDSAADTAPQKCNRVNERKASILQSALLFISFAVITIGVTLEASSKFDFINGFWAFSLILPSTGFLLSLANWYFITMYKSRKAFSNYSCSATLGATAAAYIWAGFHYGINIFNFSKTAAAISIPATLFFGIGIVLTAVSCALSKTLSDKYAKMLGKE